MKLVSVIKQSNNSLYLFFQKEIDNETVVIIYEAIFNTQHMKYEYRYIQKDKFPDYDK